jgi:hypothetical protein
VQCLWHGLGGVGYYVGVGGISFRGAGMQVSGPVQRRSWQIGEPETAGASYSGGSGLIEAAGLSTPTSNRPQRASLSKVWRSAASVLPRWRCAAACCRVYERRRGGRP